MRANIFTVISLPVLVEWSRDDRRIYVGGVFVERDLDVFSEYFSDDLERQIEAFEKEQEEIAAEVI